MIESYCPECGDEISGEVRISIGGLFRGNNSWIKYTMLHDGVTPDWDKIAESNLPEFKCLQNIDSYVQSIANKNSSILENPFLSLPSPEYNPTENDSHGEADAVPVTPRRRRKRLDEASTTEQETHEVKQAIEMNTFTSSDAKLDITMITRKQLDDDCSEIEEIQEYLGYLPNEQEASLISSICGYSFDLEHPYSESCKKFVWLQIIIMKMHEIVEKELRMVPYLLSVVFDSSKADDWYNLDLKECFSQERCRTILSQLMPLVGNTLAQENETVQIARKIMDTAKSFKLNFNSEFIGENWKGVIFDNADNPQLPINFWFGPDQQSVYLRICPHCGAHIPSKLGLYKQNIVSFIGTPASGKSTMINAIYSFLHISKIPSHISAKIEEWDPHYMFYYKAFSDMELERLAPAKTDRGQYPSLTLLVEHDNHKMLYTFVDVPGEHFVLKDSAATGKSPAMHRLKTMEHSDVVCAVVASEQLLSVDNIDSSGHTKAEADMRTLNEFVTMVNNFVMTVMKGKMPPIFFIVTKPDAFPHIDEEKDYQNVNGELLWKHCDALAGKTIGKDEIDELYISLQSTNTMIDSQDDSNVVKRIVNLEKLLREQELAHKLIDSIQITNRMALIRSLSQALTDSSDWSHIPLFMVSPFGFYALHNVFSMSIFDKTKALSDNPLTQNLSEKEIELLAASNEDVFEKSIEEQHDDKSDTEVQILQRKYRLSYDDIEHVFKKYYLEIHQGERPYGLEQFLSWLFSFTGLYHFVCDANNANDKLIINKNDERFSILSEYTPIIAEHEKQYALRLAETKKNIYSIEQKIETKRNEIENIGGIHLIQRHLAIQELRGLDEELLVAKQTLEELEETPIDSV